MKKICQTYSANTLDRLEMLRMAEVRGVRVFSPALSMLRVVNRLSCTMTLSEHGIPMPDTVITQSRCRVGRGVTVRAGSNEASVFYKARGMRLLETQGRDETAIGAALDAFAVDNPVMYVQQQVDLNGRDLGLVFVGGEYRGAYARVAQGDAWTTVIHRGGRYVHADPSQELIELARRAQAPFGLDFTTVDVAETPEGPIIFEVSAFGGFRGALDGSGFNAAEAYADYIMKVSVKRSAPEATRCSEQAGQFRPELKR